MNSSDMSLFDHHQNINGENEKNDVSPAFSNDSSFISSYIFFKLFRATSSLGVCGLWQPTS